VERQFPVAEAVHLLDDQSAYDLLCGQAFRSDHLEGCAFRPAEIAPRQLVDLRHPIEQLGDRLQLGCVIQHQPRSLDGQLGSICFSHGLAPFRLLRELFFDNSILRPQAENASPFLSANSMSAMVCDAADRI
jgi:hypothetical protein